MLTELYFTASVETYVRYKTIQNDIPASKDTKVPFAFLFADENHSAPNSKERCLSKTAFPYTIAHSKFEVTLFGSAFTHLLHFFPKTIILKQKLENSACVARLPVLHRKCLSSDDSVGPHSRILFLLKKTPVQNPAVIFAAAFNFMSKVSKTKIDCGHLESNCASK